MMDRPLALFCRYFWENKNISWIYTSDADKLIASCGFYYESNHQPVPEHDPRVQAEMDDLIVAACLASESQVDRDMWGWTIRVPMKPWGLFCGVEPEGAVCARFTQLSREAEEDPVGSFVVQRMMADGPMRQTSLIPREVSPKYLVEQYFDESEQLPARICIEGNEALMALSSPDAEWELVENLKPHALLELFHKLKGVENTKPSSDDAEVPETEDVGQKIRRNIAAMHSMPVGTQTGELRFMHESVFYYGCRCSDAQIREIIERLPEDHQKELWLDSKSLEVECPRCGLKHTIYR